MRMNERVARELLHSFFKSWSLKTSSKWSKDNPAMGQCGVTALVVHDLFEGEILKTMTNEGWHYYNLIDEQVYDFTNSQFNDLIDYQHILSNRAEAFSNTNNTQYHALKDAVIANFFVFH